MTILTINLPNEYTVLINDHKGGYINAELINSSGVAISSDDLNTETIKNLREHKSAVICFDNNYDLHLDIFEYEDEINQDIMYQANLIDNLGYSISDIEVSQEIIQAFAKF